MTKKVMGGKDPFELGKIRITKENHSNTYIVSGEGIFKVFETKKEAEVFVKKLKK